MISTFSISLSFHQFGVFLVCSLLFYLFIYLLLYEIQYTHVIMFEADNENFKCTCTLYTLSLVSPMHGNWKIRIQK